MENMVNTATASSQQSYTPPVSNDPKVIAGEMLVELKAIEGTLSQLDPQVIAAKLMKEMTEVAVKKGIKLTPEQLDKMSKVAKNMGEQIAYERASSHYYQTQLKNEVNTLYNTINQDIVSEVGPGGNLPKGPETDVLVALTYEIGTVLGNFYDNENSPPMNIITAAQATDMEGFLEHVVKSQPQEMTYVLRDLNKITNQMKSLLSLNSSKSAPHKEIDASDIDAVAAKPVPLFEAGAKGSGIDAGAKLAALIDAGPMIDAAAMPSSLIDV